MKTLHLSLSVKVALIVLPIFFTTSVLIAVVFDKALLTSSFFFYELVQSCVFAAIVFFISEIFISKPLQVLIFSLKNLTKDQTSEAIKNTLFSDTKELSQLVSAINTHHIDLTTYISSLQIHNKTLANSEAKMNTLFSAIPDLLWLKDPDGVYLACNEEFELFFGAKEAEIVGKTDHDFVDKHLADIFRENDQKAMAAKQPTINEEEITYASDGHAAYLETIKTPVLNGYGECIGVLGIARNITERKSFEQNLQSLKDRLSAVIENVPGTTYRSSSNNSQIIEYVSDEITNLTGYARHYFLDQPLSKFQALIHPDDLSMVRESIESSLLTNKPYVIEYRIIDKGGETHWVFEKGRVEALSMSFDAVVIDISERKQIENELTTLRSYLEDLIDSVPSILISIDQNLAVTEWNLAASEAAGYSSQNAVGKHIVEVFPSLKPQLVEIQNVIHTRKQLFVVDYNHDGKTDKVENLSVYPTVSGQSSGAVIRIDDVTEHHRLEELMIQSEKMLSVGGLAAGMAHEINNPLAGIMQTSEVMLNRLTNTQLQANIDAANEANISLDNLACYLEKRGIIRMSQNIKASGMRVSEVVSNMLSFARKSSGKTALIDIVALLDKTIELAETDYDLKKQYDFKAIKIEKDYADVPMISCEESKIQQVFLNILRNGAEAMQESGIKAPMFKFSIFNDTIENMVCVVISDNGPGIDNDVKPRIFEPFYTTKGQDVGTGLGLSVSYFIVVERHGGKMKVESELGNGAQFYVWLPYHVRESNDENSPHS
jgi:PAS domain S-box-containing protein